MFSCQCWHGVRERLWGWLHPLHMTQQYCLASMAAQLSSIGISHHNLLPHFPSIRLSTFNAALTLGLLHKPYTTAPNRCTFQATCGPVWGMYGCSKGCLSLIPFRLPQISCFTLSLKCFSSDSDSCLAVGIRWLHRFPYPLRASPVLLTLLFPLSYRVLHGSITLPTWCEELTHLKSP